MALLDLLGKSDRFTRQTTTRSSYPTGKKLGVLESRVTLDVVVHERDAFFERRLHEESALEGRQSTLVKQLAYLEAIMGESDGRTFRGHLDALWSAWVDLADDPSGSGPRTLVQLSARRLVQNFHVMDRKIVDVKNAAQHQVDEELNRVNVWAKEIAQLNRDIGSAESNGQTVEDVRERRSSMTDSLATLVPVRVVPGDDGAVSVIIEDVLLVDAGNAMTLTARSNSNGELAVGVLEGSHTFLPRTGTVSALLSVVNEFVPRIRRELDEIASVLGTELNSLHRSGVNQNGGSDLNFFGREELSARSITLHPDIEASVNAIVASATGAAGDGSVASAIAELGTAGMAPFRGLSLGQRYTEIADGLRDDLRKAESLAEAHGTLVSNVEVRRTGVRNVSVDDEMAGLISQQQAYAAAARIIKVANEMLCELSSG